MRDLICANSLDVGGWSGKTKTLVVNRSLNYRGDLMVRCVPKGAIFEITLERCRTDGEGARRAGQGDGAQGARGSGGGVQKKADKLAPPEPVPPLLIERKREREPVRRR